MLLSGGIVGLWLLVLVTPGRAETETLRYAGVIQSVDKSADTIVVGDMGPRLKSGDSRVVPHTIRLKPSTEFVRVKRASGVAPSGWLDDYVETKLSAWDLKPRDWVAVAVERDAKGITATKITVVEMSEP